MRNDQEFAHLEAHEEYPDGFQSKMKTQRKLVQNAVGQTHTFQSSSTADIPKSNRYKPAKWAAAILIMFISGTIYLGWYPIWDGTKAKIQIHRLEFLSVSHQTETRQRKSPHQTKLKSLRCSRRLNAHETEPSAKQFHHQKSP